MRMAGFPFLSALDLCRFLDRLVTLEMTLGRNQLSTGFLPHAFRGLRATDGFTSVWILQWSAKRDY